MYALLPSFFAFFVLSRFKALFFLSCTFVPPVLQKSLKTKKKAEKTPILCCAYFCMFFVVLFIVFSSVCLYVYYLLYLRAYFCTFLYFCAILRYIYNV